MVYRNCGLSNRGVYIDVGMVSCIVHTGAVVVNWRSIHWFELAIDGFEYCQVPVQPSKIKTLSGRADWQPVEGVCWKTSV